MTCPDWLPDWRDGTQYPAGSDELGATGLAWEFLRRNAKYQRDFERYGSDDPRHRVSDSVPRAYHLDTDSLFPNPARNMPVAFIRKGTKSKRRRLRFIGQEPRLITPEQLWEGEPELLANWATFDHEHQIAVVLDPTLPTRRQVTMVKDMLREHQEQIRPETARRVREEYIRHLRVLDGLAAGATIKEMAVVLLPHYTPSNTERHPEKVIEHGRKAGVRLRDRDYWRLTLR